MLLSGRGDLGYAMTPESDCDRIAGLRREMSSIPREHHETPNDLLSAAAEAQRPAY
jgi:hypothetical protein